MLTNATWHRATSVTEMIASTQDRKLCAYMLTNATSHRETYVIEMIVGTQDRRLYA